MEPDSPLARLSLAQFYRRTFRQTFLAGASARTLKEYAISVAKWSDIEPATPLAELSTEHLARFRDRLAIDLSPATVNKHLRHLNHILGKAGPAGPRNRDALEVIPRAPWCKPLRTFQHLPRVARFEDIDAMHEAAVYARWPQVDDIERPAWWRALIVLAYTTAFRKTALLALTWSDVDIAERTITLPARFDKCRTERRKPLALEALKALLACRSPKHEQLLPWPHSEQTFYREWRQLQELAGIPKARRFTLHDLKRTAGTKLAQQGNPWAVQMMLDHASIQTSRHYVNAADSLRPALERLPMPGAFAISRERTENVRS